MTSLPFHRLDDGLRILVEVRQDDHDPTAVQEVLKVYERLDEIGVRPDLGRFDGVQQAEELALASGGLNVILDVLIEDDESGGVTLNGRHVAQRRSDEARVIELVNRLRSVAHRRRSIEEEKELGIGLALVAFQVAAVGAGEDVPIDVPEIVALGVGAVLGEFLGEAEVRRAVEAVDESVDDGLGDEVKRGDGGKCRGVEEALKHFSGASGWVRAVSLPQRR
jgi:hypothetical protein